MLSDSVVSAHSKRSYLRALDDLLALVQSTRQPINRALVMAYRAQMIRSGLSPSTINVRLCAIRKLTSEARDNGLLDPLEATRIVSVPGVRSEGLHLGHWLTQEEVKRLFAVLDRASLIGKRNYALISFLVHCALRREEAAGLEMRTLQLREGRWCFVDMVGKGGRLRTIAVPSAAKAAVDEWVHAAGFRSGPIFRAMRKGGRVAEPPAALSSWAVWDVVVRAADLGGIKHLGPHGLRRTCAKLCRKAGGELEQIQLMLGHEYLSTTQRYLNSTQEFRHAVNDRLVF
jgi:integrase